MSKNIKFTTQEVLEFTKIPLSTLKYLLRKKLLRPGKLGKRNCYSKKQIHLVTQYCKLKRSTKKQIVFGFEN